MRWPPSFFVAALGVGALLGAMGGMGCADRGRPEGTTSAAGVPLTIFLVDGLEQQVFQRELAAGRLPNLAKLIQRGAYVEHGISAFPSMTGYAFYPFLTGFDATTSGVLGLRWLDRTRERGAFRNYVGRTNVEMNSDLVARPKTLFERVAPEYSSSFDTYLDRGSQHHHIAGWSFAMAKYRGAWWLPDLLSHVPIVGDVWVPSWEQAQRAVVERAIEDLALQPRVQWVSLAAPDAYAHLWGLDEGYDELVRVSDALIGEYLARAGDAPRLVAVLTDHGEAVVRENVDLRAVLTAATGLAAFRGEATELASHELSMPRRELAPYDVVVAVNGNCMNHVYVRAREGRTDDPWSVRPPPELVRAYPSPRGGEVDLLAVVAGARGVEHVAARDRDGSVELRSAKGTARIRQVGEGLAYSVVAGVDPLGYADDATARALTDGAPHSEREWLMATMSTQFPDAVRSLFRAAMHPDAGELIVTAAPGFDLAADYEMFVGNYRGGHGGFRADQLRVPYILAGPGVRAGARVATARAEDVGATLVALLGLAQEQGVTGRVLDEIVAPSAAAAP